MNHAEAIKGMLNNLHDWRNLPKYQLERRVDLFFGLFIRQIVAGHSGEKIHPLVIPEFPFRHNKNGADTKHTVNFDYVLFTQELDRMFIVELKTDPDSYRDGQEEYLTKAKDTQFFEIIEGISAVMKATSATKLDKYRYLHKQLASAGLVSSWGEIAALKNPTLELLYLGPPPSKRRIADRLREEKILIELKDAAKILSETKGEVECLFADFLVRWQEEKAGRYCNG